MWAFHQLQALKPHLPMIRFRKGGLASATANSSSPPPAIPAASHGAAVAAASAKADWSPKSTSVDWWQTPNKYRRRELDDIEIEAINVRAKGIMNAECPIYYHKIFPFQMGGADQLAADVPRDDHQ